MQRVLSWRRTQLEVEEARFRQQSAVVGELDRQKAEAEAAAIRAEIEVRQRPYVAAAELQALGAFRLRTKIEEARIAGKREAAARELAIRQRAMLEAQRRARLLERLRERREREWEDARTKELEDLAGEAYLSQWNRARRGS